MTTRLYVGNLPSSITEESLCRLFARFGIVESATVVTDVETGRSKRYGFVTMASFSDARTAIDGLNMSQCEEMTISVSGARIDQ